MNDLTVFMLLRSLLAFLFICGGLYSLKKGFQLYVNGVGLKEEGFELSASDGEKNINLSLKRVGTVVMVTSIAWGGLAYFVMPQGIVSDGFSSNVPAGWAASVPPEALLERMKECEK